MQFDQVENSDALDLQSASSAGNCNGSDANDDHHGKSSSWQVRQNCKHAMSRGSEIHRHAKVVLANSIERLSVALGQGGAFIF